MSTEIPRDNPREFFEWLYLRLKNKYNEDNIVLDRMSDILHNYSITSKSVDLEFVDNICKKHFIDFDFDQDDTFQTAMNEELKNKLRYFVLDILQSASVCSRKRTPDDTDFTCYSGILD